MNGFNWVNQFSKFQSQSRAEDVSDDIALVVEKVQQFTVIHASARREESNAGLLLSWVPVMTLQKRCKVYYVLKPSPNFGLKTSPFVLRDGEWVQMGMRGMAVFFCAMLPRTGLDSSATFPRYPKTPISPFKTLKSTHYRPR